MKFTDGYWQMRPGFEPYYAAQVHEVETEPGALTVYAPTKKLAGRGDTLNLPLLMERSIVGVYWGDFAKREPMLAAMRKSQARQHSRPPPMA